MCIRIVNILKKVFWIFFILFVINILYLAIKDVILGLAGIYPEGYTWGCYSANSKVLCFSIILAFLFFFCFIWGVKGTAYLKVIDEKFKKYYLTIFLFVINLSARLLIVFMFGIHTQYGSDVKIAIELAEGNFPIESTVFSVGSAWAIWPIYLNILYKVFGTIIFPGIILNCLYGSLAVCLVYWLILERTNNVRWGIVSAFLLSFFPTNLIWTISLRPEHLNILLVLLVACILNKMERNYIDGKYIFFYLRIILAGTILGISGFFKKVDPIIIIAVTIIMILRFLKNGEFRHFRKYKSVIVGVVVFLLVYNASINIGYILLDRLYVYDVNRNITAHYLEIGLSPWSDGTMHGVVDTSKPFNVYGGYAKQTNYDYEETSKRVLKLLIDEVKEEKNLNFNFFYNKLRIGWSNQAYYNWVTGECGENNLVNRGVLAEYLYPFAQSWYCIFLFLFLLGAVVNLKKENDEEISFFAALFIFGYMLMLLLSETQPRYKCVVYPYMCILAGKGAEYISRKKIRRLDNKSA